MRKRRTSGNVSLGIPATVMPTQILGLGVVLGLLGCGETPQDSQFIAGFNPEAAPAGYTRLVAPPVNSIQPGSDEEHCQWVAAPSTEDRDVLSVLGTQSFGGHHAALYASTKTRVSVGESHLCTEDDMMSFSFLGAIGGEGTSVGSGTEITGLPPGLNFRLRKGLSLVVNAHYLNASPAPFDAQTVMDVKFAPASPEHTVADLFANNGAGFSVPPGETASYEVECALKEDLNFVMVTNHMHEHGIAAVSELLRVGGERVPLVRDDAWRPEQKFKPHYEKFSVAAPMAAKAGDRYHTRCTWRNPTDAPLAFPKEMCAGVGFYFPGRGMIACSNGDWSAP
jgi:hypothetical protein